MRISVFFILIFVMMMFVGQKIFEVDKEHGQVTDIYNLTENIGLNASAVRFSDSYRDPSLNQDATVNIDRVINIIFKYVDFMIFTVFEVSKWAIEFGYNHAESISFQSFLTLFYWVVIIMIISIVVPLIIPIIAVVYLSAVGMRELYRRFKIKKK